MTLLSRWRSRPDRPHDLDGGCVTTDTAFVIYSSRPAHVHGPDCCCHPDDLELSFLESGHTFANVGGRNLVLPANYYSIISAGVEHRSHTGESATRGVYLHVAQSFMDRCAEDSGLPFWGTQFAAAQPIPIHMP